MVGDARRPGGGAAELTPGPAGGTAGRPPRHARGAAELTAGLRAGYDAAAAQWADGPGRMYARLATALVALAPVPLAGGLVLDLGAGDGVAGRAALAAGARRVVAADLSLDMLRRGRQVLPSGGAVPYPVAADAVALPYPVAADAVALPYPVAADAVALPFRDHSFDLVAAAFCLNHLSSLAAGLAEARRVSAAIAASTFAPGWTHPAKDAVDQVLRSAGYRPPDWYASLSPGSRGGDPGELAERACAAGFTRVRVRVTDVRAGPSTPAALASWRLGMAHVAPFLRSLDAPGRAAIRAAAERAVAQAACAGPLSVSMVVLTAG